MLNFTDEALKEDLDQDPESESGSRIRIRIRISVTRVEDVEVFAEVSVFFEASKHEDLISHQSETLIRPGHRGTCLTTFKRTSGHLTVTPHVSSYRAGGSHPLVLTGVQFRATGTREKPVRPGDEWRRPRRAAARTCVEHHEVVGGLPPQEASVHVDVVPHHGGGVSEGPEGHATDRQALPDQRHYIKAEDSGETFRSAGIR